MKNKILRLLFTLLAITTLSFVKAQDNIETKWWNPLNNTELTIMEQGWPGETESPFDRLPAKAKKTVRKPVWDLSHNSAGLVIRFKTNARDLKTIMTST